MTPEEIAILVKVRDEASKHVDEIKGKFSGLGDTIGKVGTIAGGFLAANVIAGGVQKITGFIGDSIAAVRESIQVNAQLDAVLKSTGGAANVTANQVKDYAAALEKNSLFEDEAILNGQNLLLTFTNIKNEVGEGNDIFDQTSQIMLDMAQAMGTDASGSAIMLGKALNDPTQGISALTRVGVTFTEEQKNQIKAMQEAGDMAGAQGVILAELNKEFGGSAKAASDAAGAQEAYKDKMNDLKETIGAKLLPIQEKWMQLQVVIVTFIADKVIPILESLYAQYFPQIAEVINNDLIPAFNQVLAVVQEHWPLIQDIIAFAVDFVKTQIEGMIQTIQGIVEVVTGVIALIDALAHGDWSAAWDAFVQILDGFVDIIEGTIKRMFGNLPEIIISFAGKIAGAAYDIGKNLADSLVNGMGNLAGRIADKISIAGISASDVAGFVSSPFRASGGPVRANDSYIVGENGPELFSPNTSGMIVPNHQLGGGEWNPTFVFQGPVYGEAGATAVASRIGWESKIDLERRGMS